ncbi:MAG: hypothetical protein Q8M37_00735 [Nevskia sp.]|nr:hypothetical protein [Nevskia sp.]
MTQKPRIHLWLLALTFLVGQWLTVVHGTQHALNAGDELVACEICVASHAAAPPPAAELPVALLPLRIEAPLLATLELPALQPLYRPPPRGPPLHLA